MCKFLPDVLVAHGRSSGRSGHERGFLGLDDRGARIMLSLHQGCGRGGNKPLQDRSEVRAEDAGPRFGGVQSRESLRPKGI